MEVRRASTFLGCGCAVAIVLFLSAVLAVTWTTYRSGTELARTAEDPQAAAEKAREVVGFAALPAGYRAYGALSVPLLLDVAFFLAPVDGAGAAQDPAFDDEAPAIDRGFLYVRLRDWMGRGDELEEALGGSAADAAPIRQDGLDFSPREVVARGQLDSGGATVTWLARRGEVSIDPGSFGGGGGDGAEADRAAGEPSADGSPAVLAVLTFDCPREDSWQRLGVWFAPDPAPGRPVSEVDWSGGPGDPAAVAAFLDRFELCG